MMGRTLWYCSCLQSPMLPQANHHPCSVSDPNKFIVFSNWTWMGLLVWLATGALLGVGRHFIMSLQETPCNSIPSVPTFALLWPFSLSCTRRIKFMTYGFFQEVSCDVVQVHLFHLFFTLRVLSSHNPMHHQTHASHLSLEELTTMSISPLWPDSLNYLQCQANASLSGASQWDKLLLLKSCSNTLISFNRKQGNPARKEH